MTAVRVYVSSTLSRLAEVVASGGVGPVPFMAHAVTDRLQAEYADGSEEEWEYAAMSAAAQASLGLIGASDPPRRVVIAVDVPSVAAVEGAEPSLVEVHEVVPATKIAAVHVDSVDAEEDVRAAAQVYADAEDGDADAEALVERCLDHEPGWFATQEVGALIEVAESS